MFDDYISELTCEEYYNDLEEWETEQAWRDGLLDMSEVEGKEE